MSIISSDTIANGSNLPAPHFWTITRRWSSCPTTLPEIVLPLLSVYVIRVFSSIFIITFAPNRLGDFEFGLPILNTLSVISHKGNPVDNPVDNNSYARAYRRAGGAAQVLQQGTTVAERVWSMKL